MTENPEDFFFIENFFPTSGLSVFLTIQYNENLLNRIHGLRKNTLGPLTKRKTWYAFLRPG